MKTRTRIMVLAAGSALAVGLSLGLYVVKLTGDATARRVGELDSTLRANFDRNARLEVETALSLLKEVADQEAAGKLAPDQARRLGADLLRQLRYDKDGYFWADTLDGTNVVLLGKDAEGKSRWEAKDKRGSLFIQALIGAARAGGGYTDYWFPRKDATEASPKRAYTQVFAPFGWVVGTGNYVDDIDAAVAKERAQATSERRAQLAGLLAAVLLIAALAAVAASLLARSATRPLERLVAEASRLHQAVRAGTLDVRADPAGVGDEFRPVLEGMNDVQSAFVEAFRVSRDRVQQLAAGEVPALVETQLGGEFAQTAAGWNRLAQLVEQRDRDTAMLVAAATEGRLDVRADASRYTGESRRLFEKMNAMLDALVGPLRQAAAAVDQMARGELPAPITAPCQGELEVLTRNVNACRDNLAALLSALQAMAEAQEAGDLDAFVDQARLPGAYGKLAASVNGCVRGLVQALFQILEVLGAYGDGDFSPALPEYRGKRIVATQRVAAVRANLQAFAQATAELTRAAAEGRLDARAEAGAFRGDWARLLQGVNGLLDAVMAPTAEATEVLQRLAERDLRARMQGRYSGDHARLQQVVNGTGTALHDAMRQVAAAVEQVSSAATQIASSSQAVASGASQQAASIEETNASTEAVTATSRRSAESARLASGLASSARNAADEGTAAVGALQQAMGRIRQASEGTSQIIKDVSDIAFQTNLLALNAAVEAARAGEAGRGFAVVAEEVRSLALRAKEAAGKTEDLIRQSVAQVGEGEGVARQVAARLADIASGIGQATSAVDEISGAAQEQAAGLDQVNRAIAEMDKVTQQNAASAEESSSAAAELNGQAEELAAMVASFRMEAGEIRTPARASAGARLGQASYRP